MIFSATPLSAETVPIDETYKALKKEFEALSKGGSRKESLKNLKETARQHPNSCWRDELLKAIRAIEKAVTEEITPIDTAGNEIKRLVAALRDAAPDGTFVNGTLVRGHFLSMPGPARDLFLKGEKAVPDLIDILDDDTMTRFHEHLMIAGDFPKMLRRSDIALSIIETMFHLQLVERYSGVEKRKDEAHWRILPGCRISLLELEERRDCIERIRRWWKETVDQPFEEKMIWQIRHGAGLESQRFNIRNLGSLGLGLEKALPFVRTLYLEQRAGGYIDVTLASFLAQSGDLTPLDDVYREAADRSKKNLSITGSLEYLIRYGGRREFSFLRRHLRQTSTPNGRDALKMLANVSSPEAIPLLSDYVADSSNISTSFADAHIDAALESLQKSTGADFGFSPPMSPQKRSEVAARALAWWRSTHFETPWKAEWERLPLKERATIERWVALLGDPVFELREKAVRELKSSGPKAAWICLVHSRENPDLEIRRRAGEIIEELIREE